MKKNKKFSPKQAMRLALKLAKKGFGWVEPNPPVGCVILDSEYNFLAGGWHEKYGGDHAEIQALKKITNKKKLKGAQIFLTLEPCHHTGKTPPCSKELAQYPIQSVTYGTTDPFTAKKGLKYLQKKGVQIIKSSDFQEEMEKLVAPFKFSLHHKKAFVSLKVAVSLDGKVALKTGESQWITGEKSRQHSRFLRATHSAVLIGVNTFLKDNPSLNIRLNRFKKKENKVIILDPKGKSFSALPKSKLFQAHLPNQIIVICSVQAKTLQTNALISSTGVKTKFFKTFKKYLPLSDILQNLYQEEGIQSVLVEGGAFCHSQFLKENIPQRLYCYMAPRIIGMGESWSGEFLVQCLSKSLDLNSVKINPIGKDFLLEGYFPNNLVF